MLKNMLIAYMFAKKNRVINMKRWIKYLFGIAKLKTIKENVKNNGPKLMLMLKKKLNKTNK